jgi:uncharacterized membrane protein YesL
MPTEPSADERRSGLGHVLRATLSQAWDYVFLVMGGSLLWAVSLGVPAAAAIFLSGTRLAIPVYYLLGALSVGPVWVALYGLSAVIARREMPTFGDLFRALRRFYWRGVALFLVYVFVLGGCLLAAWFYHAKFSHWAMQSLALLWVYAALLCVMIGLYAPAFLVRDDRSIWTALRKASILTLAYPGQTVVILLQVVALVALIALPIFLRLGAAVGVSVVLFFLVLPMFTALLATNAVSDLLERHVEPGDDKETAEQPSNSES